MAYFRKLRGVLFCLALVSVRCAFAQSLEDMDKILGEASSYENFRKNPTLIERYWQAAQAYYGNKVNRSSFDTLLGQIDQLNKEIPGFGDRLLAPASRGLPYHIDTAIKTSGRDLNQNLWSQYFQQLQTSYNQEYQRDLANRREGSWPGRAEGVFKELDEKIKAFRAEPKVGTKKEQMIAEGNFFKSLRENPQVQGASKHYLSTMIQSGAMNTYFLSGDPDLILAGFGTWDKHLKTQFPDLPASAYGFIKNFIPKPDEVIAAAPAAFPQKMRLNTKGESVPVEGGKPSTYDFKPVERPFNSVLKGVILGECVGSCPRRWAIPALEGVRVTNVERNGSYLGFIQEIPMVNQKGKTVYATEFGSQTMAGEIIKKTPDGSLVRTPFIDEWIRVAPRDISRVRGQSNAIGNAGVLGPLDNSKEWVLRIPAGAAADYRLKDSQYGLSIIGASHVLNIPAGNNGYGNGWISEGTLGNSGQFSHIKSVPDEALGNPDVLAKYLNSNKIDQASKDRLRVVLERRAQTDPKFAAVLFDVQADSADSKLALASILKNEIAKRNYNQEQSQRAFAKVFQRQPEIARLLFGDLKDPFSQMWSHIPANAATRLLAGQTDPSVVAAFKNLASNAGHNLPFRLDAISIGLLAVRKNSPTDLAQMMDAVKGIPMGPNVDGERVKKIGALMSEHISHMIRTPEDDVQLLQQLKQNAITPDTYHAVIQKIPKAPIAAVECGDLFSSLFH